MQFCSILSSSPRVSLPTLPCNWVTDSTNSFSPISSLFYLRNRRISTNSFQISFASCPHLSPNTWVQVDSVSSPQTNHLQKFFIICANSPSASLHGLATLLSPVQSPQRKPLSTLVDTSLLQLPCAIRIIFNPPWPPISLLAIKLIKSSSTISNYHCRPCFPNLLLLHGSPISPIPLHMAPSMSFSLSYPPVSHLLLPELGVI